MNNRVGKGGQFQLPAPVNHFGISLKRVENLDSVDFPFGNQLGARSDGAVVIRPAGWFHKIKAPCARASRLDRVERVETSSLLASLMNSALRCPKGLLRVVSEPEMTIVVPRPSSGRSRWTC